MRLSIQRNSVILSWVTSIAIGFTPLTIALIAGYSLGSSANTDGLNVFVEEASARSISSLSIVATLIPIGFAFAAGMISTVNPCGFAMLPAYLGLYLSSSDNTLSKTTPFMHITHALLVGLVVTGGFILLFGLTGLIIGIGARSIVKIFPWVGLGTGFFLTAFGIWILRGGTIYTSIAERAGSHIEHKNNVRTRDYFLFGLSYGIASLSCTLPIFLTVISSTLVTTGVISAIGQFIVYAAGMGTVIIALTLTMALFKATIVTKIKRIFPYMQLISALFMILAGAYIVFYWLTIGGMSDAIHLLVNFLIVL